MRYLRTLEKAREVLAARESFAVLSAHPESEEGGRYTVEGFIPIHPLCPEITDREYMTPVTWWRWEGQVRTHGVAYVVTWCRTPILWRSVRTGAWFAIPEDYGRAHRRVLAAVCAMVGVDCPAGKEGSEAPRARESRAVRDIARDSRI